MCLSFKSCIWNFIGKSNLNTRDFKLLNSSRSCLRVYCKMLIQTWQQVGDLNTDLNTDSKATLNTSLNPLIVLTIRSQAQRYRSLFDLNYVSKIGQIRYTLGSTSKCHMHLKSSSTYKRPGICETDRLNGLQYYLSKPAFHLNALIPQNASTHSARRV